MQATLRRMASSTGTTPAVSAFTAAANAAGITGHAANPTSFPTMPSALTFDLVARCGTTKARAATLKLPHGTVQTPLYMPVATQASLKGLTSEQLENVGCKLCLNNTYHLGLKPGQKVLDAVGGAHKLQGWNGNLLTAKVTEEGVRFLSPHDGSPMLLTPEHSISLQNSIGSDIIMQLDDVIATTSPDDDRMREAMYRSIRWLDRCIAAHEKPETQNLFCIIQGGLDLQMRKECCEEMVKRNTPGIAIGGLSGGEEKAKYCEVVDTCTGLLPDNKPRYVMGVGYPEDLVVSVALGADMFDCVWATRTARFGNAITSRGVLNLRQAVFSTSLEPIDPDCTCPICLPALSPYPPTSHAYTASTSTTPVGLGISRAFIHHLAAKETAGAHLLTIHNVYYLLQLMADARQSIVEGRFERFLRAWFARWNGWNKERYSEWAVGALRGVGVDLLAEGEGDLEGKEGK